MYDHEHPGDNTLPDVVREILTYINSEFAAGRYPVPEHYVFEAEALLRLED